MKNKIGLYLFMFVLNCVTVFGFSMTSNAETNTEYLKAHPIDLSNPQFTFKQLKHWGMNQITTEYISTVEIPDGKYGCIWLSPSSFNTGQTMEVQFYDPLTDSFEIFTVGYSGVSPDVYYNDELNYGILDTNFPIYSSNDYNRDDFRSVMRDFFTTGNQENLINESLTDESFYLIGFKADNKINASWTGTSLAPDVEYNDLKVLLTEEYCLKTYPTQVADVHVRGGKFDISLGSLFCDIDTLQHEDTDLYLFCVHFRPYYTTDFSVVYGKDTLLYFNPDGTVKEISGDKETIDSSIGYLQGVKYVEDIKSHDFTLSWEKSKDYDDNYRVEIMTDVAFKENLTSNIVVKQKMYQSYKFAPYYSDLEYSDNTRNVVQFSLGSTDYFFYDVYRYYLRIAYFDPLTKTYSYGGWVKLTVVHDSPSSSNPVLVDTVTGNFDDDGTWVEDKKSDDSYHDKSNGESGTSIIDNPDYILGTDIDGNLDLGTLGKSFLSSFNSLFSYIGTFPTMLGRLFNFIPSSIIALLSMAIIACIILRILGR